MKHTGMNGVLKKQQAGLTLIELMVAMVIGLFLLLSISSVYLSNLQSSVKRDQYSLLEDNARLALDSMKNVIQHTGFNTGKDVPIFPSKFITADVTPHTGCSVGHALFTASTITQNGTGDNPDSIGVVYLGNDAAAAGAVVNIDCSGLGQLVDNCQKHDPTNTSSDNTRSYIYNTFFLENNDKLQCVGSLDAATQLMAEGIENMQITYGVNTDGLPFGGANKYVNASNVAAGEWAGVVSVQIAILVKSQKEVKNIAEQKTYTLLDKQITSPSDKYQRAVFSTTVHLRNN